MWEKNWNYVRWLVRQIVKQFFAYDCLSAAGALTYTTLFAVVPMMTVAYAIFSILPVFSGVDKLVENFIFTNFVPNSGSVIQEKLVEFSSNARDLTAVGFGFLVVTAFMMLVSIEKAFNTIWHVAEPRHGLQRFLLYWAVLSLGPALILSGLLISQYLLLLPLVSDLDAFGIGKNLLGLLPWVFEIAAFTVLFFAVPNCFVPFRHAVLGGLLTTIAFELAKGIFGLVVSNSSIEPVYGAFAAVPLFLAWLWLVWVLILSGGIFVRTLSLQPESIEEDHEPLLVKCARVIEIMYQAHMEGRSVRDDEISHHTSMTPSQREKIFDLLIEMHLVHQTSDEQWALARNLKGVSLWDLYQWLPEGVTAETLDVVSDMKHVTDPLKSFTQLGSQQLTLSLDEVFQAGAGK